MRFPLQVVAKSRTKEEHIKYYRWVRFIKGETSPYDWWDFDSEPTYLIHFGYRTRWFHFFMDMVPKFVWKRLPVKWQSAHLFEEIID